MVCPNCKRVLKLVCPVCRTVNDTNTCKKCGYVIVSKCHNCGKINRTEVKKCKKCGFDTEKSVILNEANSDEFVIMTIDFPNIDGERKLDAVGEPQLRVVPVCFKIKNLPNFDAQ